MSDDVAAVLANAIVRCPDSHTWDSGPYCQDCCSGETAHLLEALDIAGYAIVKIPEGLAVAHGARLVKLGFGDAWVAIEEDA